jgi:hypothetical protein
MARILDSCTAAREVAGGGALPPVSETCTHTSDWNLVSHCNGVICRVWLCGTTCSLNSRVQVPLGVRRDIDHMQRLSK